MSHLLTSTCGAGAFTTSSVSPCGRARPTSYSGVSALEDALRPIHLRSTGEPPRWRGQERSCGGQARVAFDWNAPPSPGEFLAREGIAEILAELSGPADYVVIDAAPLLSVGDALLLGAEVDAIVVVARLGVVSSDPCSLSWRGSCRDYRRRQWALSSRVP